MASTSWQLGASPRRVLLRLPRYRRLTALLLPARSITRNNKPSQRTHTKSRTTSVNAKVFPVGAGHRRPKSNSAISLTNLHPKLMFEERNWRRTLEIGQKKSCGNQCVTRRTGTTKPAFSLEISGAVSLPSCEVWQKAWQKCAESMWYMYFRTERRSKAGTRTGWDGKVQVTGVLIVPSRTVIPFSVPFLFRCVQRLYSKRPRHHLHSCKENYRHSHSHLLVHTLLFFACTLTQCKRRRLHLWTPDLLSKPRNYD